MQFNPNHYSRTRSRVSEPVTVPVPDDVHTSKGCNDDQPLETRYENDPIIYVAKEEVMHDNKTVKYFTKVKNRSILPVNLMSRTTILHGFPVMASSDSKGVTSRWTYGPWPKRWHWCDTTTTAKVQRTFPPAPTMDLSEFYSDVIDQAKRSSISKAHATMNAASAEILVSFAEASKSVMTLANTMLQAATLFVSLRNAVFKKRSGLKAKVVYTNLLDSLSDTYLSVRYGYRPLSYEVADISKAINDTISPLLKRKFRASSTVKKTVKRIETYENELYPDILYTRKREIIFEVSARTSLLYRASEKLREEFTRVWGLSHIPSTIYELIPGSFILDWFWDFNTVIRSWESTPGINCVSSSTTTTCKTTVSDTYTLRGKYGNSGSSNGGRNHWSISFSNGSPSTSVFETKFRTPAGALPLFPSFNPNLDAFKVLDLAAIAFSSARSSSHNLKYLKG
jgi:hypothetical protein